MLHVAAYLGVQAASTLQGPPLSTRATAAAPSPVALLTSLNLNPAVDPTLLRHR